MMNYYPFHGLARNVFELCNHLPTFEWLCQHAVKLHEKEPQYNLLQRIIDTHNRGLQSKETWEMKKTVLFHLKMHHTLASKAKTRQIKI